MIDDALQLDVVSVFVLFIQGGLKLLDSEVTVRVSVNLLEKLT